MRKFKWYLLQLFADGGESAGGDSGTAYNTVVSDGDDGHQRLRELGVPESKIRKDKVYGKSKAEPKPVEAEQAKEEPETASEEIANPQTPEGKRMTWDEIKADPEYSQHLNAMMRERGKKVKDTEDAMGHLRPALEMLAVHYGLDVAEMDYKTLAEKISGDNSRYRDRAADLGLDDEKGPEMVKNMDMGVLSQAMKAIDENDKSKEAMLQNSFVKIQEEAKQLEAEIPGFNLANELRNPEFARMVMPGVGFTARQAYEFVHRDEMKQAAVDKAVKDTMSNASNAIRSNTMRPAENGGASTTPSVTTFSYKNASPDQRAALKARIRQAAARGEILYPGQ